MARTRPSLLLAEEHPEEVAELLTAGGSELISDVSATPRFAALATEARERATRPEGTEGTTPALETTPTMRAVSTVSTFESMGTHRNHSIRSLICRDASTIYRYVSPVKSMHGIEPLGGRCCRQEVPAPLERSANGDGAL